MIDVWLRASMRWCLRVFFLVSLVGAGRLAYVAYSRRPAKVVYKDLREYEPPSSQPTPEVPFGLDALKTRLAAPMPSELLRDAVGAAAGASSLAPLRKRVYLVVNVGPDRSELLINGVSEGNTPYVGEISCQTGTTLTITVLPKNGMPKQYLRDCDRREIRIDE